MTELRCPTCHREFKKEATPAMPFCSQRCRLIDLGRWFTEEHSVPHEPSEEEMIDLFSSREDEAN